MQKTNFKTRLLALLTAVFMVCHVRTVCSVCRCRRFEKKSKLLSISTLTMVVFKLQATLA